MKIPARLPEVSVRKTALYSIFVNAVQIIAIWALTLVLVIEHRSALEVLAVLIAVLVTIGAIIDIREAQLSRRKADEADTLGDMVRQMDELNRALRAQRHDFLNHLQVVFSLIEMEEHKEAADYIEKVYGDMQSVSRMMRTDSPAINALLRAKLTDCEEAGILTELDVAGRWKNLPMPAWEMCRVLSNLIDNACDALENVKDSRIRISLREDVHGYTFSVMNNGPEIEESLRKRIFEPGVSSHGEGRGMGLYIVRKTIENYGGEILLTSDSEKTIFSGFVPHKKDVTSKG